VAQAQSACSRRNIWTQLYRPIDYFTPPAKYLQNSNTNKGMVCDSTLVPCTDGFIARQTQGNDPLNEGLTFRLWNNGNARIAVPIPVSWFSPLKLPHSDTLRRRLHEVLIARWFKSVRIADFSYFTGVLTAMVDKYLKIRKRANVSDPFFGKVELRDIWRVVPFVNLEQYVADCEKDGPPLIQDEVVLCPPGVTPETLIPLRERAPDEAPAPVLQLLTAIPLAFEVLRGAGVSLRFMFQPDGDISAEGVAAFVEATVDPFSRSPGS